MSQRFLLIPLSIVLFFLRAKILVVVYRICIYECTLNHIQGVPRNMTVGKYFQMFSSIKLFDAKENKKKYYMAFIK